MNQATSKKSLDGQIAVVTGAAQGLGLATSERLASDGAHVLLADVQLEKVEVESNRLCNSGLTTSAHQLNVTESKAVNDFFAQARAKHGRIDILANSAGVGQDVCPIVELSDEEWDRVLAVTLTGTFYCCRAVGRIMEEQESGSIVNFASINGQNPAALVSSYNVAKAGIISLTKTMAIELAAYGVRVNAVAPGPVYTAFNQRNMAMRSSSLEISEEEMIERVRKAIPLGRWGKPEDIAQAVAYLCSPDTSWVTGEILRISGGLEGVSAAPPKRE